MLFPKVHLVTPLSDGGEGAILNNMDFTDFINERVHTYYWMDDLNCAAATLKTLAEIFDTPISSQVLDSAAGLPDKGVFGAHCGLVQGAKMFIGILGSKQGLDAKTIRDRCYDLTNEFQGKFGNLTCKGLRPQGFQKHNPPHLCEKMTIEAITFSTHFLLRKGVSNE